MSADQSFLSWPFFEERHRVLAKELEDWSNATIHDAEPSDADVAARALVTELGRAGFLKLCVGDGDDRPDVRSLASRMKHRNKIDRSAPALTSPSPTDRITIAAISTSSTTCAPLSKSRR